MLQLDRRTALSSLCGWALLGSVPQCRGSEAADETSPENGEETIERGVRLGAAQVRRWRAGVIIRAETGGCSNLEASIPVPMDWPEQTVTRVAEDVSSQVQRMAFRVLHGGVQQMLVSVPRLARGQEARAVVELDVKVSTIEGPTDTSLYEKPDRRTIDRDLKRFLSAGNYIETRHPIVRGAVRRSIPDDVTAWEQVRAIYDFVRENVEYREGPLKGGVAALRDKHGDCESMTCLFVAMCRYHQVPARMVWVVDHAYPEFYLVDDRGDGHWFPCQVAGTEAFGSMPDTRPILQKGEGFVIPERRREGPQHYVAEHLTGVGRGSKQPTVEFLREYVER